MGAVPVYAGRSVINAYHGVRTLVNGATEADEIALERPPQLEPQTLKEDTITQDWRWLALRCERRLIQQAKRGTPSRKVAEVLGDNFNIDQFACFVPRTVLEAIADGRIRYTEDFDVIIENFNAAVVFCDASGFTALTEALDKQPNGAEKLGDCINNFFAPLIQIVHFWGGDIIKFSGDALTIVWPVDDDEDPADGEPEGEKPGLYKIDKNIACRMACQCCLDLHSNLNYFPTPVTGKSFTLHIGVGYGKVTILQVGGTLDRWEYVVAGPPMQEISIAEPLAASGETVISYSVVEALNGEDGASLEFVPGSGGFAKFLELRGPQISPPPPLENILLEDTDVELLRRFIPPAVFKRLTAGYNVFINELRRVSVVFVGVHGMDVSSERGAQAAHKLMQVTQKAAYTMEGSVNKFLVDDKGVLILLMFGLPPVYHLDDAPRAVMAALRVVDGLKTLGLSAGIGVATGRVWCGTVGCDLRKEYTAMGDTVNLAARLMSKTGPNEINCDLETARLCQNVMTFTALPPVKMKGKAELVAVFQPTGTMRRTAVMQISAMEPIATWRGWKHKRRVHRLLLPGYEYRAPIVDVDIPPADYPSAEIGPQYPWEITEPWLPSLRPTIDLGGVAVILGKETEGTTELVQYISNISKILGRAAFFCSNMPDSCHVNIGNVPLLAWRKLSTELIEHWRWSKARERRGYSTVDIDNSVYGLTKELVHPIYHWRLPEMKSVVHGLILPSEVPENRFRNAMHAKKENFRTKASVFMNACKSTRSDAIDDDFFRKLPAYQTTDDESSVIPIICSLVNGFSMYECTIIVLHVRSGTSLFASMDSDSWKVARLVARVAMMRRRRKIELDMRDLKSWRKRHSRECLWCRGANERFVRLNGEIAQPTWTCNCKPPPSQYLPPFLFVLVCSGMTSHISEQKELIEWAKECNGFIQMKRMSAVETSSYLAHCLSVTRSSLPDPLVEYVHRISAGIQRYCYLTAKQLLAEHAITVEIPGAPMRDLLKRNTAVAEYSASDARKSMTEEELAMTALGDMPLHMEFCTPDMPFELHAEHITGQSGVVSDCETEDADSEQEDGNHTVQTLGIARNRELAVYKFRTQWARVQLPSGAARLKGVPKVSDLQVYNVDKELSQRGNIWMKAAPQAVAAHAENFSTQINALAEDARNHAFERHERPVLTEGAADESVDDTLREPEAATRRRVQPFLPPGPDIFMSHAAQVAFAPSTPEQYMTSFQAAAALEQAGMACDLDPFNYPEQRAAETEMQEREDKVESAVESAADVGERIVVVHRNLKSVPFVSELRAAAMSLMERLEPDEQLAAKVASVFPVAFSAFELQAVYPRIMTSEAFQKMVENLIKKDMLEPCGPPSEDQLNALDLAPLQPTEELLLARKNYEESEANSDDGAGSIISEHEVRPNRWGFDVDGNPVYYRFTSIAHQHVVADLLMSAERAFLSRISRKVVSFRRTYGLKFLIAQIDHKLSENAPLDHEAVVKSPISETEQDFVASWDDNDGNNRPVAVQL